MFVGKIESVGYSGSSWRADRRFRNQDNPAEIHFCLRPPKIGLTRFGWIGSDWIGRSAGEVKILKTVVVTKCCQTDFQKRYVTQKGRNYLSERVRIENLKQLNTSVCRKSKLLVNNYLHSLVEQLKSDLRVMSNTAFRLMNPSNIRTKINAPISVSYPLCRWSDVDLLLNWSALFVTEPGRTQKDRETFSRN